MSNFISLSQAHEQWLDIMGTNAPKDDYPAMSESWAIYTDDLARSGELSALQYHYAPAWDEDMPGTGKQFDPLSDDREFILDAMAVTMEAKFVPFSVSRNKAERNPSLNWKVTLKRNGTTFIESVDYMQGCANAPSYKQGSRLVRDHNAVASECETGYVSRINLSGDVLPSKRTIPAPEITDVFYSLLQDSCAIDAGGFANWCDEYGYSSDSISAKAAYDACIDTAMKLRTTFGVKTLEELQELFHDM